MSGISFVGNLYVYLIVFENTDQIQTKYRPNIKYKYMPFCDFQFNYKYKKNLYSNTIANTDTYLNPTLIPTLVCHSPLVVLLIFPSFGESKACEQLLCLTWLAVTNMKLARIEDQKECTIVLEFNIHVHK